MYNLQFGSFVYSVPAGSYPPKVGGSNGANITTFINQTVSVPTVVYRCKNKKTSARLAMELPMIP